MLDALISRVAASVGNPAPKAEIVSLWLTTSVQPLMECFPDPREGFAWVKAPRRFRKNRIRREMIRQWWNCKNKDDGIELDSLRTAVLSLVRSLTLEELIGLYASTGRKPDVLGVGGHSHAGR